HVGKPLRQARVYATARGVYELWLNGRRVGDALLAPGWTDYHQRIQYQTYDVTALLQPGANALGAILGPGWHSGYVGYKGQRAIYGAEMQLLLQLHLDYEDGTEEIIVSDGAWRGATGAILGSDLLMGEIYDARREPVGWAERGFDDAAWQAVQVAADRGAARL